MSEVLEKKWYVVRAVSGQENKIKGYIESEVERHGFGDFLEEVLVPTEKVVQIRNGKKISKERVYFPGLEDDPGHEIARRQMKGFGGLVSFSLRGGMDEVRQFLGRLRYAHRAASLGSVGTLIGPPAVTSHVELTPEARAELGIPETLIRCSVGIENLEDLIEDFRRSLG